MHKHAHIQCVYTQPAYTYIHQFDDLFPDNAKEIYMILVHGNGFDERVFFSLLLLLSRTNNCFFCRKKGRFFHYRSEKNKRTKHLQAIVQTTDSKQMINFGEHVFATSLLWCHVYSIFSGACFVEHAMHWNDIFLCHHDICSSNKCRTFVRKFIVDSEHYFKYLVWTKWIDRFSIRLFSPHRFRRSQSISMTFNITYSKLTPKWCTVIDLKQPSIHSHRMK